MSNERGADVDATDVLHLDMDSFFAAVEVRDDPSLVGKPVVVGGTGPRGVIASASYEARAYGIRSATPTLKARALCPHAVFLPGRRSAYEEASEKLVEILLDATPLVETVALDEAFLNLAGAHGVGGTSFEIGQFLRRRVYEELQLWCSVGIGSTKLIAKLASNGAKPIASLKGTQPGKQILLIPVSEELAFLHRHGVRAIPGIGPKTEERLTRLGIGTVGELAVLDESTLVAHFGKSHGSGLFNMAHNKDVRIVDAHRIMQSIGHEETFDVDIYDEAALGARIKVLSASVASRCRSGQKMGRTVNLKIKFGDFSSITRARSAASPVVTGAEIAAIAKSLLSYVDVSPGVRLIGISVSNLEPLGDDPATQLSLFGGEVEEPETTAPPEHQEELEIATDEIRRRFGQKSLISGASMPTKDRPATSSGPHSTLGK